MFSDEMKMEIPMYCESGEANITLKVSPKIKALWLKLGRTHRVRVAQITREFLEKTLPEIERKVSKPTRS